MTAQNTQQEVEELVSFMSPNQFLQRDLKKLEVVYIAGIAKGIETARQTIEKCGNKTPSK